MLILNKMLHVMLHQIRFSASLLIVHPKIVNQEAGASWKEHQVILSGVTFESLHRLGKGF